MSLRNMAIRTRLGLAFSIAVIILAVSAVIVIYLLNMVDKRVKHMEKESIPLVLIVEDMSLSIAKIQQWLTDVSVTHNIEGYNKAEKEKQEFIENLTRTRNYFSSFTDPDAISQLHELGILFRQFYEIGNEMANVYVADKREEGNKLMVRFEELSGKLNNDMERLRSYFSKETETDIAKVVSTVGNAKQILIYLGGCVIIVNALFFYFVTKSIVVPLKDAAMKINSTVSSISSGVQEEMSVSTQQSSSVAEITATMEELSVTSKQIADNANAVLDIALNTQEDIEKGTREVQTVMNKMDEISHDNENSIDEIVTLGKKSREITKIMTFINNIADQTKLIAFNASIEASSASESGKRFGVVAIEIRRLADSVMESTGEIESKINEIQEAVNRLVVSSEKGSKSIHEGVSLVKQTSVMLSHIVEGSRATTDAAKQISLSTQQQKSASEQVVTSLKEISEGSKQINVSIDQSMNTSKTLTALSHDLVKMAGEIEAA